MHGKYIYLKNEKKSYIKISNLILREKYFEFKSEEQLIQNFT